MGTVTIRSFGSNDCDKGNIQQSNASQPITSQSYLRRSISFDAEDRMVDLIVVGMNAKLGFSPEDIASALNQQRERNHKVAFSLLALRTFCAIAKNRCEEQKFYSKNIPEGTEPEGSSQNFD